jgi:serine/threonine protein kinase
LISDDNSFVDVGNELRAAEKIGNPKGERHQNIVAVLATGRVPGSLHHYYLDMEFCVFSLKNLIDDRWPLNKTPPPWTSPDLPPRFRTFRVWHVMQDLTCGLTYIHEQGEVHRDLKPANCNVPLQCLL